MKEAPASGKVLVIGGGVAGITATLDLAEQGHTVYLLEKEPSIGGRMAQLDKTFPTLDCSICILAPKMVEVSRHPNVKLLTYSELSEVQPIYGGRAFRVKITRKPRYVDETTCTSCGDCVKECPVSFPSEFEEEMSSRRAIYIPFPQAVPNTFVIDKRGVPPCRVACPAGVNVQGYVALITQGKFKEALELIRRDIPFPAVCGRVCFHPCEAECKRGEVDEPLAINALKRFIADYELKEKREKPLPPAKKYKEKIAIIGSGPAGLTAAHELVKMGYPATVFESLPKPGGMLRVGIPEYRLPKKILDAEIDYIQKLGVEIRTNTLVGKELTFDELLQQGYKAIFIAVGTQKSRKLGIPGEELKGVLHGLDFLRDVNLGKKVELGDKIAIIGGGNVAIDAARTALRLGAKEVTVVYRRSKKEMPANVEDVEQAEREGVKFHFLALPTRVLGKNGRLIGMECIRMRLAEPDETGRRRPVPIKGSEFTIKLNTVIPAIGESVDSALLPKGVEVTGWNTVAADPVTLQTSLPNIFAGGDAVSGPATVIEAIAAGKRAAVSIDRYLRGEDLKVGREEEIKRVKEVSTEGVEKKPRQAMLLLPPDERLGNFREVELGFTREIAMEEAGRCLFCGGCCECLECERVCKPESILHQQKEEHLKLEVAAIIVATGFDLFDPSSLTQYGYGRFPNVITSLECERLMNAAGPTGGKIVRPSDNAEPHKIAFIQCVGSRNVNVKPYCSQICCIYATKEAIVTKEHNPNIDIKLFYNDLRAAGKGHQELLRRAADEFNIDYINGLPNEIQQDPQTKKLAIRFAGRESDKMQTVLVDMTVLCPAVIPKKGTSELAKKLGIDATEFGFFQSVSYSASVDTSVPGIYLCGACEGPKDISHSVAQASAAATRASLRAGLAKAEAKPVEFKERPIEKEPRIGVFICNCGINIGAVVNVPKVMEFARNLDGVVRAEEFLFTCSQDAVTKIKEAIWNDNLNRVIVASCTPRTHEPLFRATCEEAGLNPYLFEMVNIREHDSWVHSNQPEEATKKAMGLIQMAVAKAKLLQPLKRLETDVVGSALVVGGGVPGLVAAKAIADKGFKVYLIEERERLGGQNAGHYSIPFENIDVDVLLDPLIKHVKNHGNIEVFLSTQLKEVRGSVGNFGVTLVQQGKTKTLKTGVVVVARETEELKPEGLYDYGKYGNVVTTSEFQKLIREKKLVDGENIAMILCVGAREKEGRTFCSATCCSEALNSALKVKENYPNSEVYILYRDIVLPLDGEKHYREARGRGVVFVRYLEELPPEVTLHEERLTVKVKDAIAGIELSIPADRVVLVVPMVPGKNCSELASTLKVSLTTQGFFLEAHPKLRPLDFATDGIYLCGTCHSPQSIAESVFQALGATSRALIPLMKGKVLSEAITAEVDPDRCIACGNCEVVCEYGAISLERPSAKVNPFLCKGCGSCAVECPEVAITMHHFTNDQLSFMIRAAMEAWPYDGKPRVLAFFCNWCCYAAADMAGVSRFQYPPTVRIIRVMCSGRVDQTHILQAFLLGADGVLIGGCHPGDCHYISGNLKAEERVKQMKGWLKEAGLEPERLRLEWASAGEGKRLAEIMKDFTAQLEKLGPSSLRKVAKGVKPV